MFELILRVLVASGGMAAAGILGRPGFELTWKVAAVFSAYSYLLYMIGQKGMKNPGLAGLVAVADCGVVAIFLADLGLIANWGALAAVPMVIAYYRDRANAAMMSPIVASWLLVGANLFGGGNAFTATLLLHALGVLVLGVALSMARTARENRRANEVPMPEAHATLRVLNQYAAQSKQAAGETMPVDAQEYQEFRESFRTLSDSARDLEKRGRKDRACVQLFESVARQPGSPFAAIAARVLDLSGAEGVGVCTLSQSGEALAVRSTAGRVETSLQEAVIELPRRATDDEIEAHAKAVVASLRDPAGGTKFASVLLKVRGKLVGMLALFHPSGIELEASLRRTNETADFLAELLIDCQVREDERRRMKEAELLYTVATTTLGAATPATLASRVARDLWDAVMLDHLSVWTIEGGTAELIAHEGTDLQAINDVAFPLGRGLEGWLRSGAPVLSIENGRNDARFPSQEAVRRRIGSLLIVPLEFGAAPFGYLVASTSRPAAIGAGETETLRAVCAELSQALARMLSGATGPEGLATPKEFYEIVRQQGQGCLVYLEVPQREELNEAFGKPAIEHAVRRFAVRLKSELPVGAAMTRRNEGDYVAFVPSTDEAFVRAWANDATTLASMVGVRTPDGRTKIPLALRAKVAPLNQQLHRISPGRVA